MLAELIGGYVLDEKSIASDENSITSDENSIISDEKSIIKECVGDREYKLQSSHTSKNAKFKSFNLSVLVNNNTERLELFTLLKKHSKFVSYCLYSTLKNLLVELY